MMRTLAACALHAAVALACTCHASNRSRAIEPLRWLHIPKAGTSFGATIYHYLNGLAAVTAWAYRQYEIPEDTAEMEPSPLGQIYNLRGQAEAQSRTENSRRSRLG